MDLLNSTLKRPIEAMKKAPGVKGKTILSVPRDGLTDFIESITIGKQEVVAREPLYVLDLGEVATLMERWSLAFPSVEPFYAFKSNPNPSFVGGLAALGARFDCASQREIETVLSLGVSPDRIVFANPCKTESHIQYAKSVGVNLTTYDSIYELQKIHRLHPECGLLLRIKAPDDSTAKWGLGSKFGALPDEIEPLLEAAGSAQLRVVGVSFHVGSSTRCASAYESAIALSKKVFDTATELGLPRMKILDIGGGFVAGSDFESTALTINKALKEHFTDVDDPDLRVIAEPGRYFAATCFTLAACIIGKRVRGRVREYWIGDGTHGSFHVYGHDELDPIPLACNRKGVRSTYPSTVFGPTCDSRDVLVNDYPLPELEVSDWLVFRNMGAYTSAMGTNFNGFCTSQIPTFLVISSD